MIYSDKAMALGQSIRIDSGQSENGPSPHVPTAPVWFAMLPPADLLFYRLNSMRTDTEQEIDVQFLLQVARIARPVRSV